jgi:hypothetical protein
MPIAARIVPRPVFCRPAVIPTAVSKYFRASAIKQNAFRFEFCRLRDWQATGRFAPQHVEIFLVIVRAYF